MRERPLNLDEYGISKERYLELKHFCKRYAEMRLEIASVIDPERCPDTAKEFSEYEYERDGKTGEVLEGYPDLNNHHIDAVRYAMESTANKAGDTAETRYKSIFV